MTSEAKILIGIGLATLMIVFGAAFFLGKPANSPIPSASANPALLVKETSHQTATSSAKVTIVEFGDYQCPACFQAYPITKQILQNYGDQINFVFRNFPLRQHQNAQISAEAAEAAGTQGKFWQMHDKLYETQNSWAGNSNPEAMFIGFAKDLGLDVNRFQSDISSNKFTDIITQDQNDGNALGVNATPTFFVNGEKLEGVPSYDQLKAKIDSDLK